MSDILKKNPQFLQRRFRTSPGPNPTPGKDYWLARAPEMSDNGGLSL